ncbi:hypothetical protein D3093_33895 (plasmid) [Azospirillum argentinense]|uniref:Uncharacterized protein n=1 Tax=Azospirillum argentinense TaxID=2970906 RepID=A0A4D8PP22_9PROT|nr:hypothetical protein [Azospirillum argentinense]QCO00234.1 hypothetical protein D3093_33895 [Azospirillum argentinense]
MSSPVQLSPQAHELMKALHQVLVWIRTEAVRHDDNSYKIIAVLANLAHNWPDWVAGNDFFKADMFIKDLEQAVSRDDIPSRFWTETIAPYLRRLAESLRVFQTGS